MGVVSEGMEVEVRVSDTGMSSEEEVVEGVVSKWVCDGVIMVSGWGLTYTLEFEEICEEGKT